MYKKTVRGGRNRQTSETKILDIFFLGGNLTAENSVA
jgi:hypothetical protein